MGITNIKEITIVTDQGVKTYTTNSKQNIIKSHYSVDGDSYECVKVLNRNQDVIHEIRCMNCLIIEYFNNES